MKKLLCFLGLVGTLGVHAQDVWREATVTEAAAGTMGKPAVMTPRRVAGVSGGGTGGTNNFTTSRSNSIIVWHEQNATPYTTISNAIRGARTGDTIQIMPSDVPYNLGISNLFLGSNMTVIAYGAILQSPSYSAPPNVITITGPLNWYGGKLSSFPSNALQVPIVFKGVGTYNVEFHDFDIEGLTDNVVINTGSPQLKMFNCYWKGYNYIFDCLGMPAPQSLLTRVEAYGCTFEGQRITSTNISYTSGVVVNPIAIGMGNWTFAGCSIIASNSTDTTATIGGFTGSGPNPTINLIGTYISCGSTNGGNIFPLYSQADDMITVWGHPYPDSWAQGGHVIYQGDTTNASSASAGKAMLMDGNTNRYWGQPGLLASVAFLGSSANSSYWSNNVNGIVTPTNLIVQKTITMAGSTNLGNAYLGTSGVTGIQLSNSVSGGGVYDDAGNTTNWFAKAVSASGSVTNGAQNLWIGTGVAPVALSNGVNGANFIDARGALTNVTGNAFISTGFANGASANFGGFLNARGPSSSGASLMAIDTDTPSVGGGAIVSGGLSQNPSASGQRIFGSLARNDALNVVPGAFQFVSSQAHSSGNAGTDLQVLLAANGSSTRRLVATFGNDAVTYVGAISVTNMITTTGIGGTLAIKSGSNAKAGTFTLVAGTATVGNTSVTANSVIVVTVKTAGGVRLGVPDCVPNPGTGFTATEVGGIGDTSTYNYVILEVN